jgi:hypothetical protein
MHEQCLHLFTSVYGKLKALGSQTDKNKETSCSFFIPRAFLPPEGEIAISIPLPLEAIDWLDGYQTRRDDYLKLLERMNQFFVLMVLGAFGSLVFLTERYIKCMEPPVAAFFFRPILGMFLALAMYIVHLASHAVVSSANYREMRLETMYFLAFVSGLLSEKVYSWVVKQSEKGIPAGSPGAGDDKTVAPAEADDTTKAPDNQKTPD